MTFRTLLRGTAAIGLAGGLAAAVSAEAAITRSVTLNDPSTFANETGDNNEVPALAAPGTPGTVGAGGWSADPSLTATDKKQHLIYLQGDKKGPWDNGGKITYDNTGGNAALLFPLAETVKIQDIVSISFDTNAGNPGWFVDLTTDTGTDSDDATWYGSNLDFTTSRLRTEDAPNGFTSYIFDDEGGSVQRDNGDLGKDSDNDGTEDHKEGPFDFNKMEEEFGSEEILYIALGTSSDLNDFGAEIDNFRFTYYNGTEEVTTLVDLEPVPVPAALPLFATGLAGVAAYTRWRKRQAA